MKITSVKTDEERAILTALIVHDEVLSTVHSKLGEEKRPFPSKWCNTILQWCRSYFTQYQKAPRKHIKQLFHRYAEKVQDEDAVALIEAFLSRLSKDYEAQAQEMNEKYLLDLASRYFECEKLRRHVESLEKSLDSKDLEEARTQIAEYRSLDFSATAWSDPFAKTTIKRTLRYLEKDRSLVQFKGELGEFLSPALEREGFVSFAAPEKRGKSFWLLEVAYQALRQRRKVLYYVLGDMSEDQANKRLYSRITRLPSVHLKGEIRIPTSLVIKDGEPKMSFRNEKKEKLTGKDIWQAAENLRQSTATKELPIKVKVAGASVISASDIERDVKTFAQAGWVPDVVVLDYADLLLPEPHSRTQEFRHQVNESWKVLRRIALDYHLLMLTATQAAATAYESKVIRKRDFSEDKRKNSHVTGMLGINQSPEEKKLGLYRLNWVFLRDGEWADTQQVWTAGNLAIASPCILSAF